MYSFENESPKWLPGLEPEPLARRLAEFFRLLDACYSGRCIIWEQWDHESWDHEAVSLCRELGYSRGAAFLTAYGYSILDGARFIPACAPAAPPPAEAHEASHSLPWSELSASAQGTAPEQASVPSTSAIEAPAPQSSVLPVPAARPSSAPAPAQVSGPNLGEDSSLFYTGVVTAILPYNNSGFVRRDQGGDYYFNVRDFAHHVELQTGLKVRFRLERRMDHKHRKLRLNAVELSVIASDSLNQA